MFTTNLNVKPQITVAKTPNKKSTLLFNGSKMTTHDKYQKMRTKANFLKRSQRVFRRKERMCNSTTSLEVLRSEEERNK